MLLAGDLGFSSLVLVVCLVFLVVSFVIRRKWRLSVARTEEIRRLLVLASEEAARTELEATISYAAVSMPASRNNYQCAVCYCPTTTRCARCKSVKYCSGKCQIIHWRQGHKEKCQPPRSTFCIDEDGRNYREKFAKQGKHFMENDGYESARIEISPSESALSNSCCSAGVPGMKDDNVIVDPVADTEGTYCTESSGSPFSGFSTSTLRDESSDDVSVSESISSNESEGPGGQTSSDTAPDIQASIVHNVDQTKPSSSNFARLVDSVDSFSSFSKLSQISSHDNCGKSRFATSNASFQSTNALFRGSTTSTGKASSVYWGRALDSAVSSSDAHGHSAMSSSSGAVNGAKLVERATLSKDVSAVEQKVWSSQSASCGSSNCMDKNYSGDSKVSKIGELRSESATPSHTHQPSCPEEALSVPNVKLSKANNVEAGCTSSSKVASFSSGSLYGLKSSVQKVVDQFMGTKSGRYSEQGLFPYDLFVWLYTSNKVEMRPFGLINCGNSCYANVVLQCLAFTPPLAAYLVQGLHSKICVRKEWCFTCDFEDLILKAKEGKSPLSPIHILSHLQKIGTQLGSGREEDAHEFLRCAIDKMQSICLKEARVSVIGSSEEETTFIGLTFGGHLLSKIKCMKCHHKSKHKERMMDLAVEIEGEIGKLEDALKRFTSTEILDGDNKYHCSRCKSYEKAKKKLTILEAPNILTIALKRFQSGKFGKLNKAIRFPEILDLAPYMSGASDKFSIYRLYGVIVHLDVMNAAFSGHYVCYIKTIQNKWFKIDDSQVTPVELERVLAKGAYMLLYARCSPMAPGMLRGRMVSHDPKNKGSGKNTTMNSISASTLSNVVQLQPNSVNNMANVEYFFSNFHRLQRILEEDSSSDNYSLTSSNSGEGSCSTNGTQDSSSTDEFSEYIFGRWNSSWRDASDSDNYCYSSSSPLYSRHVPHAHRNPNAPSILVTSRSQIDHAGSLMEDDEHWGLDSDPLKHCRNLSAISSCRETVSGKLGQVDHLSDGKSGVSYRRSNSKRRA